MYPRGIEDPRNFSYVSHLHFEKEVGRSNFPDFYVMSFCFPDLNVNGEIEPRPRG